MTHTPFHVALLVLALVHAATARGNDPKPEAPPDPCVTDLTLEKLDNPPERKTKYEVVDSVVKEQLRDVKVADQKFIAVIRIVLPRNQGKPFESVEGGTVGRTASFLHAKDFRALQAFRGRLLLNPWGSTFIQYDAKLQREKDAADALSRMTALIPGDRQPAKELTTFFTQPASNRLLLSPPFDSERPDNSLSQYERHLRLLATSPEQAEERARALLSILDQGFSRPLQVALFRERIQQCDRLREAREKLELARKSRQNLDAKLKDYEEFTPDMLAGLRVQQLQLEVDLAGVKARIATCEKLLTKMAEFERRKPIEDAKIAAEIELSGFEARRAKSAEFVTKLKERNEITSRRDLAKNEIGTLGSLVNESTREIQLIDEEIEAFGPVRLVDDRVTIHPLEWTQ
jgi:hypothetical protein